MSLIDQLGLLTLELTELFLRRQQTSELIIGSLELYWAEILEQHNSYVIFFDTGDKMNSYT